MRLDVLQPQCSMMCCKRVPVAFVRCHLAIGLQLLVVQGAKKVVRLQAGWGVL